jgi:uncharacterized membrane protein
MLILLLGLALFFAPHLLRELGLRDAVVGHLGSTGAFRAAYSLLALAGIGLIVAGTSAAPFIMLFEPVYQYKFFSHIIMLPALVLVVAGNLPLSYIRSNVQNPMLAGITLWGLAHLWSNGDLASVLLFGSFALWGGFKFYSLRGTPRINLAPSFFWDFVALIVGLSLYLGLSTYHGQIFGVGLNFV